MPSGHAALYSRIAFAAFTWLGCQVSSSAQGEPPVTANMQVVLEAAKRAAASPYRAPASNLPLVLTQLPAWQYRQIRFASAAALWTNDASPFRLGLLPAGFYFQTPIAISIMEGSQRRDVIATPGMFELGPDVPQEIAGITLPLSGFSVRSRLNSRTTWEEFMRFQGASYFRAIAKGTHYGLSARGLTVNMAEPMGEEFPAFTRFWIEKPTAKSDRIVIYALLDSPSIAGAYRFEAQSGVETHMDVDATLFARTVLRAVGVAPLTSMFLYDETNRLRRDDYRPEVHDSDGLQITTAGGESIWRPLANPVKLQISAFTAEAPRGFGLVQRSRTTEDFEDLDAEFERRPSAWVEPRSDWGRGSVELIELPTVRETNDNITAFFRPAVPLSPGKPLHLAYRITWLPQPKPVKGLARVFATRSGASADGNRRVYMIDFVGAGDKVAGMRLDLSASAGKISNLSLDPNPAIRGVRVGFELNTAAADVIELRLRVMQSDRPISETWLYRWTAS